MKGNSLKKGNEKSENEIDFAVHSVIKYLPMSTNRIKQFTVETIKDPQLSTVITFIKNGWPLQKNQIPENIKNFHKLRDKLFECKNLLFLENKLIVPRNLRQEMIKLLHEGHLGIEKTKSQARKVFYWPGISVDIDTYIKKCKTCEKFARRNPKQKLLSYPVPERPWERVGTDIFTYADQSYCVLFDSYSNWLEILPIRNKSAEAVISQIKPVFARFGTPDIVVSDNVPYKSQKFLEFAKNWNFALVTRSPEYPQSNGLAEKAVAIAKNLLKKSLEEGKGDLCCALLNYRNSTLKGMGYSPSQLLNSRNCKTKVPITCELLYPKLCVNVKEKIVAKRQINEQYYNRNTKNLIPLKKGSDVTVLNHRDNIWEPAKIEDIHDSPRSYILKDCKGNTIRRNRSDIKPSENPFKLTDSSLDVCVSDSDATPSSTVPRNSVSQFEESKRLTPELHNPLQVPESNKYQVQSTRSGRVIKKPDKLNL